MFIDELYILIMNIFSLFWIRLWHGMRVVCFAFPLKVKSSQQLNAPVVNICIGFQQ